MNEKEDARRKLKHLLLDMPSLMTDKSSVSISEDILNFANSYDSKPDEADYYLRNRDVNMDMLEKYPQIKVLFMKYNTSIPSSVLVERLFSQAAIVLTVRRNRLKYIMLEMLILLKID